MMDAFLLVVSGAKPQRLPLKLPTIIGRSAESGLKVRAAAISRRHCELYEFEGELAVRDLGSSNGTYVNDERIDEPCFLSPGDELRVGGITFQADYELPAGHGTEAIEEEQPLVRDDVHAEPPSHIRLQDTEEGSFISIEDATPRATASEDNELNQFLQGLD